MRQLGGPLHHRTGKHLERLAGPTTPLRDRGKVAMSLRHDAKGTAFTAFSAAEPPCHTVVDLARWHTAQASKDDSDTKHSPPQRDGDADGLARSPQPFLREPGHG